MSRRRFDSSCCCGEASVVARFAKKPSLRDKFVLVEEVSNDSIRVIAVSRGMAVAAALNPEISGPIFLLQTYTTLALSASQMGMM